MVDKQYLCKCNMCGAIMFDENPGENSILIDVTIIDKPINHMVQFHDDGEFYWGCPNCSTDSYLMDLTNDNFKKYIMVTNEDIISFVEENSWFRTEDVSGPSFSSNRYGDSFNDEYGEKDYDEAIRICKEVKKEFKNIEYDIDTFDEWVYVYISITEEED